VVDTSDSRLAHALAERERTGRFKGELNFRKKDGTVFPTEHTVKTIRDDVHQPVLHISVIRDITLEHQKRLPCRIISASWDD